MASTSTGSDPELDALLDGVVSGQRRALARVLTIVEDGDDARVRQVSRRLHGSTGRARILGITGAPGVGKSTLASAVAAALRQRGSTVGIVAVDPSSPFSGGALLGDRVRMQGHHADDGVYIRSMAARGHLGGLSVATPQAVAVLDAAGFDTVLIETVGVGQSEVEVASLADTTIVALAPGMGDSIQAAKAGLLETADVFVVNKADQSGAGRLVAELRAMVELGHSAAGLSVQDQQWVPPILRTVAVRSEGVGDLVDQVEAHGDHLRTTSLLDTVRVARARHLVRELVVTRLRASIVGAGPAGDALEHAARAVVAHATDPYGAADGVLAQMHGEVPP